MKLLSMPMSDRGINILWPLFYFVIFTCYQVTYAQTGPHSPLSQSETELAQDLSKYLQIHLQSKVINAEKSGPSWIDKVNVVDSSIGITYSNKGTTIRQILASSQTPQQFTQLVGQASSLIELGVKVSLLPYGLRNHVKEVLYTSVDEQAQLKQASAERLIRKMVEDNFQSDPRLNDLPPAVVEEMKKQALTLALGKLNEQILQGVTRHKQIYAKRVDQMALETTIKELYLGYANVMGGGKGFVHVKIGKFRVESGATVDDNGLTLGENLRPWTSPVERGNNTAGTGAINIGNSFIYDDLIVNFDIYFFHNRLPAIDGQNHIANIAMLGHESDSDEEFENYREWWKIDSGLFRILLKSSNRSEIYLTVGNAKGDGIFYGVGATYYLTDNDSIKVDLVKGRDSFLPEGAIFLIVHKINDQWEIYAGADYRNNEYRPLFSSSDNGKLDSSHVFVGAKWLACQVVFNDGSVFTITVYLEAKRRMQNDPNLLPEFYEEPNSVGFGGQIEYRW